MTNSNIHQCFVDITATTPKNKPQAMRPKQTTDTKRLKANLDGRNRAHPLYWWLSLYKAKFTQTVVFHGYLIFSQLLSIIYKMKHLKNLKTHNQSPFNFSLSCTVAVHPRKQINDILRHGLLEAYRIGKQYLLTKKASPKSTRYITINRGHGDTSPFSHDNQKSWDHLIKITDHNSENCTHLRHQDG